MSDEDHKKQVMDIAGSAWRKMKDCSLAEGKDLGKLPEVRFKKLKGFYGLAYHDHFELDRTTVENLSGDELDIFLERTTIHELAHIAEYRVNKVMSHGPVWHAFDHAGGGVGLQYGYVPQEEDWDLGRKKVGAAWAILQLQCYCAFCVILSYVTANWLGLRSGWLYLPIMAAALFGNCALDAVCVRKDEKLEMFCAVKFLIVVPLAVYLLFKMEALQ